MTAELLYRVPEWLLLLLAASLFLATAAVGERRGRARRDAIDEPARSHIGVLQGAVLGLLGLLLAFSFSMAVGRYETRRNLVLAEANAIGTTWLRAGLLPAPHDAAIRALLRRYVDGRLVLSRAQLTDEGLAEAIREAEATHAARGRFGRPPRLGQGTGSFLNSGPRWQPKMATAVEVPDSTGSAEALSRLKHGFESR